MNYEKFEKFSTRKDENKYYRTPKEKKRKKYRGRLYAKLYVLKDNVRTSPIE